MTLIEAIDLYKIYGNSGVDTAVISGISLNIDYGDKISLIGPSGSGKTTLVSILTGLLKPNAGQVFWENAPIEINQMNSNKLISTRRKFLGFINQENVLLPQITVKENILLGAHIANIPVNEVTDQLHRLIEILGIGYLLKRNPASLSQGEKKRVNIAAALITDPKVLIADEPISELDPVIADEILDLFDLINAELGTALLMTTHDQSVAERGKRTLELRNGVISGTHDLGIKLNKLEQTRKIVVDHQGRIIIPNKLLAVLNNPSSFTAKVENNELILTPATPFGDNKTLQSGSQWRCVSCKIIQNSQVCEKCKRPTVKIR